MNNEAAAGVTYNTKLISYGIYAELLGVLAFAFTLFVCTPPVMLTLLPLSGLLILGGWLLWAWEFFKNL